MKRIVAALFAVLVLFSYAYAETAENQAFTCSVPGNMKYREEEYGTNGTMAAELEGKYSIRIYWSEGFPERYVFSGDSGDYDYSAVWNEENPEENFIFLDDGLEPEEGTEVSLFTREGANCTFICKQTVGIQDGRYYLYTKAVAYHEGRNYEIQLYYRYRKGAPKDKADETFAPIIEEFDNWLGTFTCVPLEG